VSQARFTAPAGVGCYRHRMTAGPVNEPAERSTAARRSETEPTTHDVATELAAFDVDALTALAQFEIEHRRHRAMQALYHRRHLA